MRVITFKRLMPLSPVMNEDLQLIMDSLCLVVFFHLLLTRLRTVLTIFFRHVALINGDWNQFPNSVFPLACGTAQPSMTFTWGHLKTLQRAGRPPPQGTRCMFQSTVSHFVRQHDSWQHDAACGYNINSGPGWKSSSVGRALFMVLRSKQPWWWRHTSWLMSGCFM